MKTQDQSILQQFVSLKKTLNQICEQPSAEEEGSNSQGERGAEQMAQRGQRVRNLSDSSATYDSERAKSQDGAFGSYSKDWHGVQMDSSEGRRGLQRRETLATFDQHRQRDAAGGAAPRQATYPVHDQACRPRWRRKEHIYENLDEIIDDLIQSSPALEAALKQQPRSQRSKMHSREAVQERESSNIMLRPHFHSVDKLPSQYFPAPSHTPSPSVSTAAKKPSASLHGPSQSADVFSSLQSADSGYMSTERVLPTKPSSDKASSARLQHFPSGLLPPHTVLQSSGAPVSGVRDESTGTRQEHHPHHQHPFTHRRQGSSPASLQRDIVHQTAAVNLGSGPPAQPVRSDRALSRNYSPKSILKKTEGAKSSAPSSKKAGHHSSAKHQKSKSGGPISFLATLNKVSGTESVSDFDFQPSNPPSSFQRVSPHVTQSVPDIDRPSSPFLSHSQPLVESHGNCESYIGLIGPAYQHQLVRPVGTSVQRLQGQHTKSCVPDARRKESLTVLKGRDSRGTKNTGEEEKHMQNFSLSQPSPSDDYDDDTLVLHKGHSPSNADDDTLVLHKRKLAKKQETALKDLQASSKKGNAVKDSHTASRRDSGSRESHGVSRRDSGSRESHGVSRRDSGSRDSHGVSRRDSGLRGSHGVSRRDSGSRGSTAAQKSQHHSRQRQEHHYGPAIHNHVVSGSEGRQQPKTFAHRPTYPVMEETWC